VDNGTRSGPKIDTRLDTCPYLGKVDDRSSSYAQPTRRHRCYRWDKPQMTRREDQRTHCLTAGHVNCPRLEDREALPVPGAASPWGKRPQSRRPRRSRNPWSVQGLSRGEIVRRFGPIVLLLVAAVLITWMLARGGTPFGPQAIALASATPTPSLTPSPVMTITDAGVVATLVPPPTALPSLPPTSEGPFQSPQSPLPTPTLTPRPTPATPPPTPDLSPPTPAFTPTATMTPLLTMTPVPTLPPTATWTPTATRSAFDSPLPTATGPTMTPTVGASGPTLTATPTATGPTPTVTPTATGPTPTRTPTPTPTRYATLPPGTSANYVVASDTLTLEWLGQDVCAKVYGTVKDLDGTLLTEKDGIAVHVEWWWDEVWVGEPGWPSFKTDGTYEFCLNRGQFTMSIKDSRRDENNLKRTSQKFWFNIDIANFTGRPIYEINWRRVR